MQPSVDRSIEAGGDDPVSSEALEKQEAGEKEPSFAELRASLKEIKARIKALERTLEAASKSTMLTEQEEADRDAEGERAAQKAREARADEDIAKRIGQIAKQQFVERLQHARKQEIAESPQGREIERLKNRQFDIEERINQILSGE